MQMQQFQGGSHWKDRKKSEGVINTPVSYSFFFFFYTTSEEKQAMQQKRIHLQVLTLSVVKLNVFNSFS